MKSSLPIIVSSFLAAILVLAIGYFWYPLTGASNFAVETIFQPGRLLSRHLLSSGYRFHSEGLHHAFSFATTLAAWWVFIAVILHFAIHSKRV